MKAMWKGAVIAQSDDTVVVEGNHYFPPESVDRSLLTDTATTSVCPWKGQASYASITVDGELNQDAAWHYDTPKEAASQIAGYYAFWRGVEIVE